MNITFLGGTNGIKVILGVTEYTFMYLFDGVGSMELVLDSPMPSDKVHHRVLLDFVDKFRWYTPINFGMPIHKETKFLKNIALRFPVLLQNGRVLISKTLAQYLLNLPQSMWDSCQSGYFIYETFVDERNATTTYELTDAVDLEDILQESNYNYRIEPQWVPPTTSRSFVAIH